jgi:hypothetical protein
LGFYLKFSKCYFLQWQEEKIKEEAAPADNQPENNSEAENAKNKEVEIIMITEYLKLMITIRRWGEI